MKKRVLFAFLFMLILLAPLFISAVENEDQIIQNAFDCAEQKVADQGCEILSTQRKAFNILAIDECEEELIDSMSDSGCWPSSSCNLKETSMAVMALSQKTSEDVDDSIAWIDSRNGTAQGLLWLLQLDVDQATTCNVLFGEGSSGNAEVVFNEDKTVSSSSNLGACFSYYGSSEGYGADYWLKISPACYDEEFLISCEAGNFASNLLAKKEVSGDDPENPLYVLDDTQDANAPEGSLIEKIDSLCFRDSSGTCDYEGSLWAAMTLKKHGYDVEDYMPYLIILAEDNREFLPEAALYSLTGDSKYKGEVSSYQNSQGYFSTIRSTLSNHYATAFAMMPFASGEAMKQKAREWLLLTPNNDGCWSPQDTPFILYVFFSDFNPGSFSECDDDDDCESWEICTGGICVSDTDDCASDEDCGPGESCADGFCQEDSSSTCEGTGNFCVPYEDCTGTIVSDFSWTCTSLTDVCCDTAAVQKTCPELGGEICAVGEECVGFSMYEQETPQGTCCVNGQCSEVESYTCVLSGGSCRSLGCNDDEDIDYSLTCDGAADCCMSAFDGDDEGGSLWWLWILIVLILIIILGIVFRDKLKEYWVKITSRKKGGRKGPPSMRGPPRGPPSMPSRGMPPRLPRQGPPQRPIPQAKRPSNDVDDVLKKLKEMGR